MTSEQEILLGVGRRMIEAEARALSAMASALEAEFVQAVESILACRGKVVFTGMGKSGHVARKIAATMTSTGTPAIFLHPAEAAHGDLGIISSDDVVVVLSYSGQTDELRSVVDFAHRGGNRIIAITGSRDSHLATMADVVLCVGVDEEDCVLDIVPTVSTTAQLAMGDALAVALMEARGFRAEEFGRFHPGGYIERRRRRTDK